MQVPERKSVPTRWREGEARKTALLRQKNGKTADSGNRLLTMRKNIRPLLSPAESVGTARLTSAAAAVPAPAFAVQGRPCPDAGLPRVRRSDSIAVAAAREQDRVRLQGVSAGAY